jgi:hypothetical protein
VRRVQAGKAEQAERELAREARKAELSDLLDQRHLPKTGTVDELMERLVEADSK